MITRVTSVAPAAPAAGPARPAAAGTGGKPAAMPRDSRQAAGISKGNVPATVPFANATDQLRSLARTYGVAIPAGATVADYQPAIIRAVVAAEATRKGIPPAVAIGVSGLESEWHMWRQVDTGTVLANANRRNGRVDSTDWGVMQINDKAHKQAFPKVKGDVVANVRFGLQFLVDQRQETRGALGFGMGDWDATLASYNLGHRPHGATEMKIARAYVTAVGKQAVAVTGAVRQR